MMDGTDLSSSIMSVLFVYCTDYRRSAGAMAVVAIVLSPLSIGFGVYAIKQARYMFKRVAGSMLLINGACIFLMLFYIFSVISRI